MEADNETANEYSVLIAHASNCSLNIGGQLPSGARC